MSAPTVQGVEPSAGDLLSALLVELDDDALTMKAVYGALGELPPSVIVRVIARAMRITERRAERAQPTENQPRAGAPFSPHGPLLPNDPHYQGEEHRRQVWADYLTRHADDIEALKNGTPPADLDLSCTRWAVLDSEGVVSGTGPTPEAARAQVAADALKDLDLEELLRSCDWPPGYTSNDADRDHLLFADIGSYVKVEGPREAVLSLLKRGRDV